MTLFLFSKQHASRKDLLGQQRNHAHIRHPQTLDTNDFEVLVYASILFPHSTHLARPCHMKRATRGHALLPVFENVLVAVALGRVDRLDGIFLESWMLCDLQDLFNALYGDASVVRMREEVRVVEKRVLWVGRL